MPYLSIASSSASTRRVSPLTLHLHCRLNLHLKVLNNEKDRTHINKLIKTHSAKADLIFLGIPDVIPNQEKEFIERTDELYKDLGTLVLVKASSFFSVLHIGDSQ